MILFEIKVSSYKKVIKKLLKVIDKYVSIVYINSVRYVQNKNKGR